jgi:hypothetical protein
MTPWSTIPYACKILVAWIVANPSLAGVVVKVCACHCACLNSIKGVCVPVVRAGDPVGVGDYCRPDLKATKGAPIVANCACVSFAFDLLKRVQKTI